MEKRMILAFDVRQDEPGGLGLNDEEKWLKPFAIKR